MSLEAIPDLMRHARSHRYAVGYFESWSIDSLSGVIDAAEQARSPVIIGFNGDFLSGIGRKEPERLELYGALGKAAAESARVPCGFVFNECPHDAWTRKAITAGFNLVMPSDPDAPMMDYRTRVAEITRLAHANGVAVEAELGHLPSALPSGEDEGGQTTSAAEVAAFVAETGIDLLAASVGNVHFELSGPRCLDLARLAAIHAATDVPLVLHGGSGISANDISRAIALGVGKVNYGTYVKQRYVGAARAALADENPNPHELIGLGSDRDMLVAGRRAVRDAVLERLPWLNSVGKA